MTVSTNDATSCGRGSPAARTHASTARFHAVKFSAMSAWAGVFSVSISSASRPIGQPYRQSVSTSRRRYPSTVHRDCGRHQPAPAALA
jgi:hypothetical protein